MYLLTDFAENVTYGVFTEFKKRLLELIGKKLDALCVQINMAQVSILLGAHRSFAAVFLKKSYKTINYPPVKTDGIWPPATFAIDMSGQIHITPVLDTHSHDCSEVESSSVSPAQGTASYTLQTTNSQEITPHHTELDISASGTGQVSIPKDSGHTVIPKVDFSSCQRLDWTDNPKDWQKYVTIKEPKTDDIISSCPMWKPMKPMKVTPSKEAIRYLFPSEKDVEKTLSTVATGEAGCAVVCRTWRFHISDGDVTEELPPGHICDILTVTDTGRLWFWVVVDSLDEEKFHSQLDYLMTTGSMLKYQIVQKGERGDLSNLWIECRLLPLNTSPSTEKSVKLRLSETQDIQAHLCDFYQNGVGFRLLQWGLTMLILSKESPLKRCIGEHTSITLSVQQAEVLMHKAKVNYITGPAGSGKSYTGVFLLKMYGKDKSVYICTTKEFLEYLKFNGCTGTLVLGDEDLMREIKMEHLKTKYVLSLTTATSSHVQGNL